MDRNAVAQVGLTARDLPPLTPESIRAPELARVDPRGWFEHADRPFEIEIGSGKGTFLVQQARLQPETNFLGIEYAGEYYRHATDRVARHHLLNVRTLYGDGLDFLMSRCPDSIAAVIHLYFPDPWPKKRHHKRRMVQDPFLAAAHRVLVPSGELRVVTDHPDYWGWMERYFGEWCATGRHARFERCPFERPPSAREGECVGTNFERKYIAEGRQFHAAMLRRA
ncbi:MAG: tRNA (guanosine(46)-N7)-methyltransferase TrmB [Planctomycetota bacterium]